MVFPLLHVARLPTDGTAAVTDAARTTREKKTLENMARSLEGGTAVEAGVSQRTEMVLDADPPPPHNRFIPSSKGTPG